MQDDSSSILLESKLLETPPMVRTMAVVRKVAKLNIPVLITGETGTGKSMAGALAASSQPAKGRKLRKGQLPFHRPHAF